MNLAADGLRLHCTSLEYPNGKGEGLMEQLRDYFYIKYTNDHMLAEMHCTKEYDKMDFKPSKESLIAFLKANKIVSGIHYANVQLISTKLPVAKFPIAVAHGTPPKHGEDSKIIYEMDFTTEIV